MLFCSRNKTEWKEFYAFKKIEQRRGSDSGADNGNTIRCFGQRYDKGWNEYN